jgi:glycosyltransferase involved in cell wall biosynthesis
VKIFLVANTAWYLYNFRLSLAKTLRERGDEVFLLSPLDDYVEKLTSEGFVHLNFPIKQRGISPLEDLGILAALVGIYHRENPNLVHHFTSKCVLYGSLAAKWTGVQSIVNSITGMGYLFSGSQFSRRFFQRFVRLFYWLSLRKTQVIFQNEDDKVEFIQFGGLNPVGLYLIQSSGVDLKRFQPKEAPIDTPIIVLVARMLRDKGIVEFVEAAKLIQDAGIKARMILVGEPDPNNPASISIMQLKKWESLHMIEWWGWKDEIENVYAQAHIACLPSYREGLPKTLIEAAACGLPIVTTDTNGCRDVVMDGVNGLLVPVRDSKKLAEALISLISNPEICQKMGKMSRKMAENKFDVQKVIERTLNVYDSRISG